MHNLNKLLPPELIEKLGQKDLELKLTLSAKDCENRWPKCQVFINDEMIFNDQVKNTVEILYKNHFTDADKQVNFTINRYGKTDSDTKIGKDGNIIANQMLEITSLMLNGIDIIKNNLIYQAKFVMDLSPNQVKYFESNNIPFENQDYHFYENGKWTLQIGLPVLTYIINITKTTETFEQIPYSDVMKEIIEKLEI